MPDDNNGNDKPSVIDLVNNAVITDPDAPGVPAFEFLAARRAGVGSPTRYIQVGVQNKGGNPVSREVKALDDLNSVIFGGSVEFWPYKTRN
jgi:hypothetical protein